MKRQRTGEPSNETEEERRARIMAEYMSEVKEAGDEEEEEFVDIGDDPSGGEELDFGEDDDEEEEAEAAVPQEDVSLTCVLKLSYAPADSLPLLDVRGISAADADRIDKLVAQRGSDPLNLAGHKALRRDVEATVIRSHKVMRALETLQSAVGSIQTGDLYTPFCEALQTTSHK